MLWRIVLASTIFTLGASLSAGSAPTTTSPSSTKVAPPLAIPTPSGPANDTVKISVPVHLVQIPSTLKKFLVFCSFRYVGLGEGASSGTALSESNSAQRDLVNGAFDGVVEVTLKMEARTDASTINGYWCNLRIFDTRGDVNTVGPTQPVPFQPLPGTPFSGIVQAGF